MPHRLRCAAAVTLLAASMSLSPAALAAEANSQPQVVPRSELLAAVSITPEAVAAAGFSVAEAAVIAQRAEDQRAAIAGLQSLRQATAALAEALAGAREQLHASPDDVEIQAHVAALADELAAAQAQALALEGAVADEVFDSLPETKVARVRRYASASRFKVEAPMRVAPLVQADWPIVELALRAEERAGREGRPLDAEHAQVLGEVRTRTDVTEAQLSLGLNLAAVRLALFGGD